MRPKYTIFNHSILRSLPLLMGAFLCFAQPVSAQTTTPPKPEINIGGDVYGGGMQGHVGTGNVDLADLQTSDYTYSAQEATSENNKHRVKDSNGIEPGASGYVPTYEEGYTLISEGDAKPVAKEKVKLTSSAISAMGTSTSEDDATEVTINAGNVRTVFGGGQNGRVYGKTTVEIAGGVIGGAEWEGTIHGGVFGAGDGAQALVFGHDEVNIKGGTIHNNIYGGGNQAELVGSTKVTLTGGTIEGSLYGGARMADIEGRTYVNVDGANATTNLIVKAVFGGNDISGQIVHFPGASDPTTQWTWLNSTHYGELITNNLAKATNASGNKAIDNTWGTYVYTTPVASTSSYKVFIGNLYGGGNGEYTYADVDETTGKGTVTLPLHKTATGDVDADWTEKIGDTDYTKEISFSGLSKPELKKTYLQLEGGVFGYVYGGGNNATVTESTDIYINNTTAMTSAFQLSPETAAKMGLQHGGQSSSYSITGTSPNQVAEFNYQFDRVFGGNNKAEMSIQPHWYLEKGIINNLYSGGNAGNMTNADGTILNIQKSDMSVVNVYGGCRMADVHPASSTSAKEFKTGPNDADKVTFVAGSSARLYISAGKITNVYGGNDISGTVYGGTDVELHGAVSGDVYGGGNGSYVYTDQTSKEKDDEWSDYYYNPGTGSTLDALLNKRPNVQSSYVHIWGDNEAGRVYVTGRAFCGGNSATLKGDGTNPANATVEIGKFVTMNALYLGSNGENMVKEDVLTQYNNPDISETDLDNTTKTDGKTNFDKYMEGVEVNITPTINYDANLNYTTQIGAFVCGGNKGSVSTSGALSYTLPEELVIFDRVVGGCNAANVEPITVNVNGSDVVQNPFHQGGVITATTDGSPKVTLNVESRLEPRKLDYVIDTTTGLIKSDAPLAFNWNTEVVNVETTTGTAASARIFKGANIYGGCYESGYINGGVVINIEKNLISPLITNRDAKTTSYQIDGNNATEANRTANVDGLRTQRDYIFTSTLSAYGGGYGEQTEIWGNTTINLSKDAQILKVFGGGEQGIVGKIIRDADGVYQKDSNGKFDCAEANGGHAYNTTINLASGTVEPSAPSGATDNKDYFNVARAYGGGFQGVVTGNSTVYLGGGKVSEAIAGAANADIYGYTEMFIGKDKAGNYDYNHPFMAAREGEKEKNNERGGNVYGGNDFGGQIWGTGQHTVAATTGVMPEKAVTSNTYVEYLRGLIGNSVYGGACGSYNYALTSVYKYAQAKGDPLTYNVVGPNGKNIVAPTGYTMPTLLTSNGTIANSAIHTNTFVNVASQETDRTAAFVGYPEYDSDNKKTGDHGAFFGGGKGYLDLSGIVDVEQTYVLLHAATSRTDNEYLTSDVYGGGYYSKVNNTMVDAYTGNFDIIYGGTFGATADQNATKIVDSNTIPNHLTYANYQNTSTTVNTYPSFTTNPNITIYGSGGYVGTATTNVNLFGGTVGEVYGGSLNEGFCDNTKVNVFNANEVTALANTGYTGGFTGASTVSAKYIFGGSMGKSVELPCDVENTHVYFHSSTAYVRGETVTKDGKSVVESYIYGGNNNAGASRNTLVDVTVPVKTAADGIYSTIIGAGNGINSIAGFTTVNLNNGAEVETVYGGAAEGSTLHQYKLLANTSNPSYGYYYQKTANETAVTAGTATTDALASNKPYARWQTEDDDWATSKHTNITIAAGATVRGNAYAGGYGEQAVVAGNTCITNYGTVKGDIYGGGYSGSVRKMVTGEYSGYTAATQKAPSTTVNMYGGVARIVYGGGYAGAVGGSFALKMQSDGTTKATDKDGNDLYEDKTVPGSYTDYTATTNVNIGTEDGTTYANGVPTILLSAYGGGEMGKVYGTTNVTMNNGYIGYEYRKYTDAEIESLNGSHLVEDTNEKKPGEEGYIPTYETTWTPLTSDSKGYFPNLYVDTDDTTGKLSQYGNLFGAGYGEGAEVESTDVKVYGGTIRNSLYGGGEVAAVGFAQPNATTHEYSATSGCIKHAGATKVTMYEGNVNASVFGGGRGYSYTIENGVATGSQFYSNGYVFGKTEVYIHGGTIGTDETLAQGEGNVFGGGNIGYVYSGSGRKATAAEASANNITEGFYYSVDSTDPDNKIYNLTEDCKVVVSPYCKVTSDDGVTFSSIKFDKDAVIPSDILAKLSSTPSGVDANGKVTADGGVTISSLSYAKGEYVPTELLNTIPDGGSTNTKSYWNKLDHTGITIRNAVFAGGNVTQGSDIMYVEATTVFGNVSASLVDLFAKDLITVGNDDVGGLYGDGNLTFVDGYRELNISNYGTDYYDLTSNITYEEYQNLNNRQRAYFSVQYKCTVKDGNYEVNTIIDEMTYNDLIKQEKITASNWTPAGGKCSLYAGRMLNTIQRADFCGVFGSRLVLKGAQDRVPAVADYTKYTINRVGEVSLNQNNVGGGISIDSGTGAKTITGGTTHGNYFGMYNVVNYLGALTSDVAFKSLRKTQSASHLADGSTYYDYKKSNIDKSYRNNGESANIVALASGVFLELVEKLDSNGEKVYGPITGVIQLDLISVKTGEGGGYVYAKNIHGTPTYISTAQHLTLTNSNIGAVTQNSYTYSSADNALETSGNFIHSTKRIVDACYPTGKHTDKAHYWYIKGDYYVYDQYISAYTGSSNSYAETISLPLAIQAGANGKLSLEDIQTGRYTYFDPDGSGNMQANQNAGQQLELKEVLYDQNEPISYWDWSQMSKDDQAYFLKDTYVCVQDFTIGSTEYKEGQVFTAVPDVGNYYVCMYGFKKSTTQYEKGDVLSSSVYGTLETTEKNNCVTAASLFHPTNAVNSTNGLVLAVSLNNPAVWDEYHTSQASESKTTLLNITQYSNQSGYLLAPTYNHTSEDDMVYGQTLYKEGAFVPKKTVDDYTSMTTTQGYSKPTGQATFEQAYIAKETCDYGTNGEHHVVKGGAIPQSVYETLGALKSNFEAGYICTSTVKLDEDKYLIVGETYGLAEFGDLCDQCENAGIDSTTVLAEAYYCKTGGYYGGKGYQGGLNYSATDYTALNQSERSNFTFNWDALDVLSNDKTTATENGYVIWTKDMTKYDGTAKNESNATTGNLYSASQSLDYTATYTGTATELPTNTGDPIPVSPGDELTNVEYESLLNEKVNYVYLDPAYAWTYTVNTGETVQIGTVTYQAGETIAKAAYDNLTETNKTKVTPTKNANFYVTKEQVAAGPIRYDEKRVLSPDEYAKVNAQEKNEDKFYYVSTDCENQYFCVTSYTKSGGETVALEAKIDTATYNRLPNAQMNFTISGQTPVEKSVLYVTKDISPYDVTQDRIITVIYQYKYTEADETGTSFENILERHVLNIHVHFESGVPSIGELAKPATILPGSTVGLNTPNVTPGAFEVIGGGFEVYESKDDAEKQQNGVDWENFHTPMYWYQNDWYVAYYAETYLGKTYSNAVPFTVANYHSMEKVMTDDNHLYIDRDDVMRDCRIYLDNHECTDNTKNDLDYLKQFYTDSKDATKFNSYVAGGNHLQFFLNSDINHSSAWTPIASGSEDPCFNGNLHGNGYTISGLDHSLFDKFCGNVYNLGVTGSFTGSGIADHGSGHAENCWVWTTAKPSEGNTDLGCKAVMGDDGAATDAANVINCYYPETNAFITEGHAIPRPESAFLNGEVAYNLNRFYLRKRYADTTTKGDGDFEYKYWKRNDDNSLTMMGETGENATTPGHYPTSFADPTFSTSVGTTIKNIGYVEGLYEDGDYIYSKGTIPEKDNERYDRLALKHYPIYPDDYIFFGQKLTYNKDTHNATPTAIAKTVTKDENSIEHERIVRNNTTTQNRVYRAPAYFRSATQSKAYYNKDAAFVAQYTPKDATAAVDIYKNMTAIDFTGANDPAAADLAAAESQDKFYAPLLDFEGLNEFRTEGMTQNLLVYSPNSSVATDVNATTYTLLEGKLPEPALNISTDGYKTIPVADGSSVKGHLVEKGSGTSYVAPSDHYLVDKQDFNAPIAYTMADGKRMWYQRKPEDTRYATDMTKGWDGVCLPFSAELVTTQTKGEITHFYQTITEVDGVNVGKVGHEYWLRGYEGKVAVPESDPTQYVANFLAPTADGSSTDSEGQKGKTYTNTYLWNTYYNVDGKDANGDDYQTYYNTSHTYEEYPYGKAGTPYIVGFPGKTYYEFDLSGQFSPAYTSAAVETLPGAQTITFASRKGGSIAVSDTECTAKNPDNGSYEFVPTYLNIEHEVSDSEYTYSYYAMNSDGTAFNIQEDASNNPIAYTSTAFRPYFVKKANKPSGVKGEMTRSIVFGGNVEQLQGAEHRESGDELGDGDLVITARKKAIVVSSNMKEEQTVTITNTAGIVVAQFTLEEGETRITPVHSSGVYIVNQKKLSVK